MSAGWEYFENPQAGHCATHSSCGTTLCSFDYDELGRQIQNHTCEINGTPNGDEPTPTPTRICFFTRLGVPQKQLEYLRMLRGVLPRSIVRLYYWL